MPFNSEMNTFCVSGTEEWQ